MRISDWSSDVCSSDLTFVAQKMEPTISMPLTSIMDQIILVGETSSVKVVEFGMAVPSPDIGEIFGLVPTAKLQRAVRVRTRDNCPLFHLITYVSRQVGDTITRADMEQIGRASCRERVCQYV